MHIYSGMRQSSKTWASGVESSALYSNWCPGFEGFPQPSSVTVFDLEDNCWKTSTDTQHHFVCERRSCTQQPAAVVANAATSVIAVRTALR